MNLNTPFNREQESMNIFRDYINFCHAEQSSLNNILHTQNTLSNNRYSMFSLMFRHIHDDSILPTSVIPPPTWPPPNQTVFLHLIIETDYLILIHGEIELID